jgi:hypothetical protein
MIRNKLGMVSAVFTSLAVMAACAVGAEGEPPQGLDPEAMAKMWEEFAATGPEHENLRRMVGEWTAETKSFWENPEQPLVTRGTAEFKMIMGGRYLVQHFKGEYNGKPFEGMGIHGYDKAKEKYFSAWIDDMSTGIMLSEGEVNEATSTLTEVGESDTPMGKVKTRSTYELVNDDMLVLTMYMTMAGAPETKAMTVTYKRK